MRFQAPRGTTDVLPSESHRWQRIEAIFRDICHRFGYREIRTPIFEDIELFLRTAGDTSEVVTKQMYDFRDKGDRHIALKPESTAPAMRSLLEHHLCPTGAVERLCYVSSPHFRYERPQKGRLRQHHQCGIELVGSSSYLADVEVIEVGMRFLNELGLKNLRVSLNSIGRDSCRQDYAQALLKVAMPYLETQTDEVRERGEKNPLRLLDWKDPAAQEALSNAPSILDFLEPESKDRLDKITHLLSKKGIPFDIDPKIVRGLDYYTETVFEIISSDLGAQSTVLAGGRYDHLVEDIGGAPTPSVGFGSGVERVLLVAEAQGIVWNAPQLDVFVIYLDDSSQSSAIELADELRNRGLAVQYDLEGRSMRNQMKQADRSGARFGILLGSDEIANGTFTLRELATGEQSSLNKEALYAALKT